MTCVFSDNYNDDHDDDDDDDDDVAIIIVRNFYSTPNYTSIIILQ